MRTYRSSSLGCRVSYVATHAALERLRPLGSVFRSGEAIAAGVSWRDLYRLRDQGEIVELSRGLYQLAERAGGSHLDLVVVSARAPHGMVCLDSALAYWELSDEIPTVVHVAVPAGAHRPAIDYPPTRVHVFAARTFALGRIRIDEEPGVGFWITDRERTVVDAFRTRHRIGEDVANGALRRALRAGARPARLAELGQVLRVWNPLATALRVLQS
jgi:predicted transcriptional regulator of viral defense system